MNTRLIILLAVIFGGLLVVHSCHAQEARILSVAVSTNRPDFDFTVGGQPGFWSPSNACHTISITLTGAPGLYQLDWNTAPVGTWHPIYPITITNSTGIVSTNLPVRDVDAQAYIRIKRR